MYKTIIASLFIFACSNNVYSLDKKFDYSSLSQVENKNYIEDIQSKSSSESGKYAPTGSAAKDSVALGLSPGWAAIQDQVDQERAGYKPIGVYCLSKSCKMKKGNEDLAQLSDKFKH